jgi:hypothetical protein
MVEILQEGRFSFGESERDLLACEIDGEELLLEAERTA